MNEIEVMAAKAALKNMESKGYFDICTIDSILKINGGVPDRRDYDVLRLLHCISFKDMEPELRRGLPVLVGRVLNAEALSFVLDTPKNILMLKQA